MDILFLSDCSESTNQYLNIYMNAINSIINTQKQVLPYSKLTFVKFNTEPYYLYVNKDIRDVQPINYLQHLPEGCTALYKCIVSVLESIIVDAHKPYFMIILTDGQDTSSHLQDTFKAKQLIATVKEKGWKIAYFGPTKSSIQVAKHLGCNVCSMYNLSEISLERVVQTIKELLMYSENIPDIDLDLSSLMSTLNIN